MARTCVVQTLTFKYIIVAFIQCYHGRIFSEIFHILMKDASAILIIYSNQGALEKIFMLIIELRDQHFQQMV